jgi:hypothetical protein
MKNPAEDDRALLYSVVIQACKAAVIPLWLQGTVADSTLDAEYSAA